MGFDTQTTDKGSGDYDKSIPSANLHAARFIALVDLGHHDETFEDQVTKAKRQAAARKIMYLWEIMDEMRADGSPFVMDNEYTWMPKLGKRSGLRKMLEAWQGTTFPEDYKPNLVKVVGQPCLLNIGHGTSKGKGNPFAKINGISRPMPNQVVPEPSLSTFVWDLEDNGTSLTSFPDWLRGRYMPLHGVPIEDYIGSSYEGRGLTVPRGDKQASAAVVGGPEEAGF